MVRNSVELRSAAEIGCMRLAGRAVAEALRHTTEHLVAGTTGVELESLARTVLRDHEAVPALDHQDTGENTALALAPNEVVRGRVPDTGRVNRNDLVTVECAGRVHGWCAWAAVTVSVGPETEAVLRARDTAQEALRSAVAVSTVGNRLGDVSWALGLAARGAGYGIPVSCGHGIGRFVREPPTIPRTGERGTGLSLRPGTVLTLVSALAQGGADGCRHGSGNAVETVDGSPCFLLGHTVAVDEHGPRVLTAL
ncbi:M24 family metallopeptidase [Actinopolyspora mortivallis]|uniref:Peptidase M24 domain-containing protein n=1 Tax=Actinopolyspora mortivallis TaxID=33906 RepID=A0A2T0GVB5_ACTMO|nr:M24 family metallopeptidase [Actinopolyspora mortivallis]PRW63058.1 hypothetical protein CEP50_12205 [Actinopolyspora mortivallis]